MGASVGHFVLKKKHYIFENVNIVLSENLVYLFIICVTYYKYKANTVFQNDGRLL